MGFYSALVATPPTEDRQSLTILEEIIKKLRPGWGNYYTTAIVSLKEPGLLDEEAQEILLKVQQALP